MILLAVESEPDNQAFRDSLGWAYYKLRRYEEAVAELRKAAQGEVEDPIIWEHLGDALVKAGDANAAVKAWRDALTILRKNKDKEKVRVLEAKIEDTLP